MTLPLSLFVLLYRPPCVMINAVSLQALFYHILPKCLSPGLAVCASLPFPSPSSRSLFLSLSVYPSYSLSLHLPGLLAVVLFFCNNTSYLFSFDAALLFQSPVAPANFPPAISIVCGCCAFPTSSLDSRMCVCRVLRLFSKSLLFLLLLLLLPPPPPLLLLLPPP